MKYNTISSSSLGNERKSTLTIYTDTDVSPNKVIYTEEEVASIRGELEIVQKALKLQTKRCRQLVTEYTRRLQEKEHKFRTEKALRDDQLAKVLRALLIFEARLRQEQKFISRQLSEKDTVIKKQTSDIKKLLSNQYCKSCKQYYSSSPVQESLDSSTEYVLTDCQEYQSSNFESLDSSCEATLSEKDYNKSESSYEDNSKSESESKIYQKNKNKDSLGRKSKKIPHRKSIGTYFEVLKLRNDSNSPLSNEDNTSNDYDNLDSLPPETNNYKTSVLAENLFGENDDLTLILHSEKSVNNSENSEDTNIEEEKKQSTITESIPVFEGGEETNDNWYASASDQEDDEQRDIYRNNPVLECMNQILLQNINDTLNSPPKTPNIERKPVKNKRVKFSDEENKSEIKETELTQENLKENEENNHDYYETPIQKSPNFYETPQSIYSNDYEQILSKCNETFNSSEEQNENKTSHYYIDMEDKTKNIDNENRLVKKSKILRTPPALPPKPVNLVSKYKLHIVSKSPPSEISSDSTAECEPDYCSISELNLPQNKNMVSFKKINVVAEINAPTSLDVLNKINTNDSSTKLENSPENSNLIVKKCVEKLNIQLAKQTPIKSESTSPKKKIDIEIPKLPQVSEILIPESEDEERDKEDRIAQDNYMRNNTEILKLKTNRKPIVISSSVSSLINSFNNHQALHEIKQSPDKLKSNKTMFSSFESIQNSEKHTTTSVDDSKSPNFEKFDLSQNFEEFKLDDCEIEEYTVEEIKDNDISDKSNSTRVDLIRVTDIATPVLNRNSVELLKKQLELQKAQGDKDHNNKKPFPRPNQPTYEHFLECTGLSTKSILTPSRMLSNHKGILKPKDVKLRSKVKANNMSERHSTTTMKYWSEPYI
ncbi:uncharacterized protein LOC130453173 [Diorhabda sublineata]|uniref:uncharacterized protein LOC130453173 n=1 Tax=Diorhabda sublineata TaxID=1163346 RepID=UPI0024E1715B|nr:uncharacterized protein LOC130453173 [Diorhabda sublineata]